MRFTISAAALLAALALSGPVSAATFTGLNLPASEGASTNDDEFGWIFSANADLLVTELGFYAQTPGSTTLNLWELGGSRPLASLGVTADDTGWVFSALDTGVELDAGSSYIVSWGGGDLGGAFATSPNYTVNSLLSYVAAASNDNVGQAPTGFGGTAVYLADIGFEQIVDTPLPGAAGFALLGLGALGLIGRRKA